MEEVLALICRSGELLRERFLGSLEGSSLTVEEKGPGDFVTMVDREVEGALLDGLCRLFPGVPVVSEEHYHGEEIPETCWIVDPLDGTRSFIHGVPHFAVSIAYREQGQMRLGITYDPIREELFQAERGGGMRFNGRRVRCARFVDAARALVALGIPFKGRRDFELFLKVYASLYRQGIGLRHTGSAALDFSYVAGGRYDGLFYLHLSPWDVAAGTLMVEEAGGRVEGVGQRDHLTTGWVIASSSGLYPILKGVTEEVFP